MNILLFYKGRFGCLSFLLSYNFISSKLLVKLTNFHKQALDTLKNAFKHNFSPHTCNFMEYSAHHMQNKTIFLSVLKVNVFFHADFINSITNLYNKNSKESTGDRTKQ